MKKLYSQYFIIFLYIVSTNIFFIKYVKTSANMCILKDIGTTTKATSNLRLDCFFT